MAMYYCFICDSLIEGNMFKAYDQNLCSSSCRECFIKKFNFNCNYKLQEKLIKKSTSCVFIPENDKPQQKCENDYKCFINNKDNIEEPVPKNLPELFNLTPTVSEEKINEKPKRIDCINISTTIFTDRTCKNILTRLIEKTKNLLAY